jgi:hypothetical protein
VPIVKPGIHSAGIAHHDDAAIPRLNEILGLIGLVIALAGPPAGTSTVLPAMAIGELVDVGSWR